MIERQSAKTIQLNTAIQFKSNDRLRRMNSYYRNLQSYYRLVCLDVYSLYHKPKPLICSDMISLSLICRIIFSLMVISLTIIFIELAFIFESSTSCQSILIDVYLRNIDCYKGPVSAAQKIPLLFSDASPPFPRACSAPLIGALPCRLSLNLQRRPSPLLWSES